MTDPTRLAFELEMAERDHVTAIDHRNKVNAQLAVADELCRSAADRLTAARDAIQSLRESSTR